MEAVAQFIVGVVVICVGVVVICAIIGWALGSIIFRVATRDHPMKRD
jgi:hypothetical protein